MVAVGSVENPNAGTTVQYLFIGKVIQLPSAAWPAKGPGTISRPLRRSAALDLFTLEVVSLNSCFTQREVFRCL
jgi:hypothetical protein